MVTVVFVIFFVLDLHFAAAKKGTFSPEIREMRCRRSLGEEREKTLSKLLQTSSKRSSR